jgi:hypothetical protein
MERKNITITGEQASWITDNDINLSQFVQSKISEAMGGDLWDRSELFHKPGVTVGRNVAGDNDRVVYDRFNSDMDFNLLVGGGQGVGKTYATGKLLSQRRSFDNDIVYLSKFHSPLLEHVSDMLQYAGGMNLNPLMIKEVGMDKTPNGNSKYSKLKAVLDMSAATTDTDLREGHYRLFTRAVSRAYARNDIHVGEPTTYSNVSPTVRGELIPVLGDISAGLLDVNENGTFIENQKHKAIDILSVLEQFGEDGDLSRFGGQSDFELPDNNFVHVALEGTPGAEEVSDLQMFLLMTEIIESAKVTNRNTIVVLDHVTGLFDNPYIRDVFGQYLRNARHHNISIQLNTVELKNVLNDGLIHQFSHKLLFKSQLTDDEANQLNLSDEQAATVQRLGAGNELGDHSDALFRLPDWGWSPIRIPPLDEDKIS